MPADKDTYQSPDLTMTPHERVIALRNAISGDPNYKGFDTPALVGVELLTVSPGRTTWSLTVGPHHANKGRNLHGGCSATILDNLTSTALLTLARPGYLDGGHVSRTLTMSYLRPVPIGMKVRIECEVVAAGKSTANLYGVIKTEEGKVCVTCVHDKAVFNKGTQKQLDFKPKI